MMAGMERKTKLKLVAAAVGALVLAVAVGAAGAIAASRAFGGDDDGARERFSRGFEFRGPDERGELPRQGLERGVLPWVGGLFGGLDAAASFLGVDEDELRQQLRDGKTLAEIAEENGKSVAGLVDAMVDAAAEELDQAVEEGRLTREQADELEGLLEERISGLVEGELRERGFGNPGFEPGFRFREGLPGFSAPRA